MQLISEINARRHKDRAARLPCRIERTLNRSSVIRGAVAGRAEFAHVEKVVPLAGRRVSERRCSKRHRSSAKHCAQLAAIERELVGLDHAYSLTC